MGIAPRFDKGKIILASSLNATAETAQQALLQGSPAGGGRYISVIARTADSPTAIINHQYTILVASPGGGSGTEHTINFRHLIIRAPWGLVDPQADPQITISPAAVVGDGVWAEQPWRAYGVLHRMPGVDDAGEPVFAVELWGLASSYGCE